MRKLFVIPIILIVVASLAVFYVNAKSIKSVEPEVIMTEDCSNLDLETTARCLQNELKEFYNYNITNIGRYLTLEELKAEGAVCWQYSDWYAERGKELGFDIEQLSINFGEDARHRFTVISDDTNKYCILDQTVKIECFQLGRNNYA